MRTHRLQGKSWLVWALLLLASFGAAQVAAWAAAQANTQSEETEVSYTETDLPVTRVVLFTSGVGYFERSGVVDGNQELRLTVPRAEMDDLLQTLVLEDLGGGTVEPVRYNPPAALGDRLSTFAVDVSGNVTLGTLLSRLPGERVRVGGAEPVEGAILGTDQVELESGESVTYVTLATDAGVRRVSLASGPEVSFLDPRVAADVAAALTAKADYRNETSASATIRFSGEGERRVVVGYVRAMPLWKSSYRLTVGDDGTGQLQGWATFDNQSDDELVDVQLSFVAGQPASFITELYEPIWAVRQRVRPEVSDLGVPTADRGVAMKDEVAMAADSSLMARAMSAMPAPAPEAVQMFGAGVDAQATGSAGATSFAYHLTQPVTVGARQSVLVPITVTDVAAERVTFYDDGSYGPALHSVLLTNDTGLQLASGTVTVYGEHGFEGNALLSDLPADQQRLLSYSADLDTTVVELGSNRVVASTRATLAGGVLEVQELSRITRQYGLSGTPETGKFLVIQTSAPSGFEPVGASGVAVTADGHLRYGVTLVGEDGSEPTASPVPSQLRCEPGADCVLEVTLERLDSQRVSVSSLSQDRVQLYLSGAELSSADREALSHVRDLLTRAAQAERSKVAINDRIAAVFADQERIRANMEPLDRGSDLYARYLNELTEQEDELAELRNDLTKADAEITASKRELADFIGGL